ncbi:MAG: NAD(P)/FAD-dependent oxidoreductase [Sphingobacteriales bacterium]|nr:MAG: NAD(P)/FAD-dependent oxidoreductase [Sphingobacteriales bacterium]
MSSIIPDYDVVIVGGGLAGLVSACILADDNRKVLLIEKKEYPFHKVCGEYISNEVLGYLQSLGFDPLQYGASDITKLRISTPAGKNVYTDLDLGGFGISRHLMDNALCELAKQKAATVWTNTKVTDVRFTDEQFSVEISGRDSVMAKLVIGSYGKRDVLDKKLNRDFIQKHTGYMGVKYHVRLDYPVDEIGLDNFDGGYCGIVKIEEDKYNICYLYKRNEKVRFKSVRELEERVLCKNPRLREIFTSATFVTEAPEAINEICFSSKQLVENHILMCGDAAGLITPLCGNGMSMAIGGAKLLGELIIKSRLLDHNCINKDERKKLEQEYCNKWQRQFGSRLFWGRALQGIFGIPMVSDLCIRSLALVPPANRWLMAATHGRPLV